MHRPIIIPPPSSVTQAWIQSFPVIKLTSSRPSGVSHFWFQVEWLGRLVSHFSFCHFLFRKMRQRESIKVAYFFLFFLCCFFGCQVVTFGFCLRTRNSFSYSMWKPLKFRLLALWATTICGDCWDFPPMFGLWRSPDGFLFLSLLHL